jgi:glycosyltransferase involved in cell wall biosynthesis
MAAEKGIEVLLKALPMVLMKYPNAFVLHASPDAIGEDAYAAKLKPLLEKFKSNYRLLGSLHGTKLSAFYRNLDCLVMCSLNNTETFGLVQIESMINGVPVVASNLPGVRQPVAMTGMGEIVEVGDHIALADAIIRALEKGKIYQAIPPILAESFDPKQTASQYIHLFSRLLEGQKDADAGEPEAYNKLRQTREKT